MFKRLCSIPSYRQFRSISEYLPIFINSGKRSLSHWLSHNAAGASSHSWNLCEHWFLETVRSWPWDNMIGISVLSILHYDLWRIFFKVFHIWKDILGAHLFLIERLISLLSSKLILDMICRSRLIFCFIDFEFFFLDCIGHIDLAVRSLRQNFKIFVALIV